MDFKFERQGDIMPTLIRTDKEEVPMGEYKYVIIKTDKISNLISMSSSDYYKEFITYITNNDVRILFMLDEKDNQLYCSTQDIDEVKGLFADRIYDYSGSIGFCTIEKERLLIADALAIGTQLRYTAYCRFNMPDPILINEEKPDTLYIEYSTMNDNKN